MSRFYSSINNKNLLSKNTVNTGKYGNYEYFLNLATGDGVILLVLWIYYIRHAALLK